MRKTAGKGRKGKHNIERGQAGVDASSQKVSLVDRSKAESNNTNRD